MSKKSDDDKQRQGERTGSKVVGIGDRSKGASTKNGPKVVNTEDRLRLLNADLALRNASLVVQLCQDRLQAGGRCQRHQSSPDPYSTSTG